MLRMILGEAGTGKTTEVLRQIKEAGRPAAVCPAAGAGARLL